MTNQEELNRKLRAALEEAIAPVPLEVFQALRTATRNFEAAFRSLNDAWADYEAAKTVEVDGGV